MSTSIRSLRASLAFAFLTLTAASAGAATTQVNILFDTDNNQATGCAVMTPTGNFDGVEQIVATFYDDVLNRVTQVTRQRCVASVFQAPETIDSGGWPVGLQGSVSVVESHVSWASLAATGPMRLGFIYRMLFLQPHLSPRSMKRQFPAAAYCRAMVRPPRNFQATRRSWSLATSCSIDLSGER